MLTYVVAGAVTLVMEIFNEEDAQADKDYVLSANSRIRDQYVSAFEKCR